MELGKILKEKQYSIEYINPHKYTFDIDENHKTETYIMQLLKAALMWTFIEIQSLFSFIPPEEQLIEEDFYLRFLFEAVPVVPFIKEEEKVKQASTKTPILAVSFTYRNYPKSADKINYLFHSLKDAGFIDTTLENFKKAFSGKEISKPIIWKTLPSDFFYFIKLIYPTYMEDLRQQQWTVACKLFVDKDGNPFDKDKVPHLKKPENT